MTAKQLLIFAEQHAADKDAFQTILDDLQKEQSRILCALETESKNKKLNRQYLDICEKLQIINLMQRQRLELFYQSSLV